MTVLLYFGIFLAVWTFASFWWLFAMLGEHYRKSKWYDYPLSVPILVIAQIVGFIKSVFVRKK